MPTLDTDNRCERLARLAGRLLEAESEAHIHDMRLLGARRDALAAEATWMPCGNAVGAMFQLALIGEQVEAMYLFEASDDQSAEAAYQALQRLQVNLLEYLEASSGVTRSEAGLAGYFCEPGAARAGYGSVPQIEAAFSAAM